MAKKIKIATSFTVDRRRWIRGTPSNTYLLRGSDGMRCCMGFFARACGFTDKQIRDCHAMPKGRGPRGKFYGIGRGGIFSANDVPGIRLRKREALLTSMFAAQGIKVRFKG